MTTLRSLIDLETRSDIKRNQYPEKLILSDTVPAGRTLKSKTSISNIGPFQCLYITGRFSTLSMVDQAIVDDGICSLRGMMIDGTGDRRLFQDYIPFDLLFSPGRIKSLSAVNCLIDDAAADLAAPGHQLFYPFEFQNLFDANSTIYMDVKNDSDADNSYDICFHGIRLLK